MDKGLVGMAPAELAGALSFREAFRGRQVYRWLCRGATTFGEMSDLAKQERDRLTSLFPAIYTSSVSRELPDGDGSLKLQVRLRDGAAVECVLLEDLEGRKTACLSSQVGCPMGCAFCKTGTLGFLRNLGADEILEQFHFLRARRGDISNVVFMGMGEPLLNLEEVRRSIAILTDQDGIGLSRRKVTISTSGLVEGIRDLARNGPEVRLAVSLTSAVEEVRSGLMPVNRRWGLAELKSALLEYQAATKERITLEAALMGGVNSGAEAARALVAWARGLQVQVNVIPWNKVPGLDFTEPTRADLDAFLEVLAAGGLEASRRMRRGRGVNGACGQLGDTLKA